MRRAGVAVLLIVASSACSGASPSDGGADAGPPDLGAHDLGTDTSPDDLGALDVGAPDLGTDASPDLGRAGLGDDAAAGADLGLDAAPACAGALAGGTCWCDPPVESTETRITTARGRVRVVSVAWSGDTLGVLYVDDTRSATAIALAGLSSDGTRLWPVDIPVAGGSSGHGISFSDLVWTGTEFGVLWSETDDVSGHIHTRLARYDDTGAAIAPPVDVSAATPSEVDRDHYWTNVVWTPPSGYVALYQAHVGTTTTTHHFLQILHADGSAPDAPVEITGVESANVRAGFAASGSGFGVLAAIFGGLAFTRLDVTGAVVESTTVAHNTPGHFDLAFDGTEWVATWVEDSPDASHLSTVHDLTLAHGDRLERHVIIESTTDTAAIVYSDAFLALGGGSIATFHARDVLGSGHPELFLRRYDLAYAPLGPATVVVPVTNAGYMDAAYTGPGRISVAFSIAATGSYLSVFGAAIDLTPCP